MTSDSIMDNLIDKVHLTDAWELAECIPDESMDMCFTDPTYGDVLSYVRLAAEAKRILKPDKPLIVWCSAKLMGQIIQLMSDYLTFVYPIFYVVQAKSSMLMGYKMVTWTTPGLIFSKGAFRPREWIIDTFISRRSGTDSAHKWNKNEGVTYYYLDKIGYPGDIVWDPFTGYGVVPNVCQRLGRHFIASDIDPKCAAAATNRSSVTQEDLF